MSRVFATSHQAIENPSFSRIFCFPQLSPNFRSRRGSERTGRFTGSQAAKRGIARSTNRKNRVLHVPATTFVITHSPSRSNHRDGFGFSEERSGRATEQVRLRASVTGSIENDRQAFVLDKASRDATRSPSFSS